MLTYKFDENTKEYLYSEEALIDPLETEHQGQQVWLLPADSTFTSPLEPKDGYAVVWNGEAWEYIEDHRQVYDKGGIAVDGTGTPYWMNGDIWESPARYMTELGNLPEGALLERPEKPAAVLAAEALAQAKVQRAAAVASITVEVDGMFFDGDEVAQERMARAVLVAESPEEQTAWVLADNTVAMVTADQLRRACRAAGQAQTALWTVPYETSYTPAEAA